jgi:hypothetical protein
MIFLLEPFFARFSARGSPRIARRTHRRSKTAAAAAAEACIPDIPRRKRRDSDYDP